MPRQQPAFPGFPPETLAFLSELKENNDRNWFEPRKGQYEEQVKAPMLALVEALNTAALDFAPDYITEPKKAVFRIYRDVRFSKNKLPFKTNIAAGLHRQSLPKGESAGFYLHLDPTELFIAGGVWMPQPELLKLLRAHIAAHHEEFRQILAAKGLKKLMGEMEPERLSRPPKGVLPDDPAADLLRYKSFVFASKLEPQAAESPKFFAEVSKRLEVLMPFLEFLNRPLLGRAKKQRDERSFAY
jgi:uncharacterized protein (TIGR02453 family)